MRNSGADLPGAAAPGNPRWYQSRAVGRWLVVLVALHSVGVGAMLLFAPAWSCRTIGGWTELGPLFFVRQAGIFHFVLAFAYLAEHSRSGTVTILVTAKCCALAFLLACWTFDGVPWVVPFSGIADGAMGLAAWLTHTSPPRGGGPTTTGRRT